MKKVLFAISAFALLMGAASCQTDDLGGIEKSSVENPLNTITVKMGGADTRLGLDGLSPYFEEGDEVFGWDATGSYTYQCTSVSGTEATFSRTSDYAPSADEGTKVNLVFAKGFSATDISDGTLSIDITEQNASSFEELPIVMTASGSVDASCKCTMTFTNETSVIKVDNCTSGASAGKNLIPSVDNLYPKMTLTIGTDGTFEKVVDATPATITNNATATVDANKAFSFCLATFPTPEGNDAKQVNVSVKANTGWSYSYAAGGKTIPANKIIKISEKSFSAEYAQLKETGDRFNSLAAAFTAANAYSGACTVKLLHDANNGTAITVTNTDGVTLDLNGCTLNISGKSTRISIASGSTLTIDGEGIYTIATATNVFALTNANSTLILKSGKIRSKTGTYAAVYSTKGNFEMYGGEVNTNELKALAIDFEAPATLKLNGGTIKGGNAKHGAVYIANASADVEVDGAKISAPYITDNDNPALNLVSGKLVLKSGQIGSSNDRWGIKVSNGTFDMTGGTITASTYPVYCAGTGGITISGGNTIGINAGGNVFFGDEGTAVISTTNSVTISGGYFYAPHNTEFTGFYTFGGTLTNMSVEVSGGYFTEDLSNTSSGYHGKLTLNGASSSCTGVTDTFGNSYTYQVTAN